MFNRRAVTRAGRTLNATAEFVGKYAKDNAQEVEEAVRLVNSVAYQYFLIPRDVREEYFREELIPDGVQLPDLPEGGV